MTRIADLIDRGGTSVATFAGWLLPILLAVELVILAGRYVFGLGSAILGETGIAIGAALLALAAGEAVRRDLLPRFGLLRARMAPRRRALADLLGALFLLLPVAFLLLVVAVPPVMASLAGEPAFPGGLRIALLARTVILLFALELTLAGVALALRSAAGLPPARAAARGR